MNLNPNFRLAICFALLLTFGLHNQSQARKKAPNNIILSYAFSLSDDFKSIDVNLTCKRLNYGGRKDFIIPTNYDRNTLEEKAMVKDLRLVKGSGKLEMEGIGHFTYVGEDDVIQLSYSIPSSGRREPFLDCAGDAYFDPIYHPEYLHMYGDKCLILPDTEKKPWIKAEVEFSWANFPEPWYLVNDFGLFNGKGGKEIKQPLKEVYVAELGSSLFFGGYYRKHLFTYEDVRFHVYIYGKFNFPDSLMLNYLQRVTEAELNLWGRFHHNKDYVISVTQKGVDCGKIGGRNMYDSFALYLSGHFTEEFLDLIFRKAYTHEYTHTWIGVDLVAINPEWQKMRWFTEGFTEYYALKINLQAGIVNQAFYNHFLSEWIKAYLLSPYRNSKLAFTAENYTHDYRLEQLAYEKGAIFAFYLDNRIKARSGGKLNLDDLLKPMMTEEGQKRINKNLTKEKFNEFALEYLEMDLLPIIEKYMVEGETIPVIENYSGAVSFQDEVKFDFGFDFVSSIQAEKVMDLRDGVPAYEAGLRNGQKIVSIEKIANTPQEEMVLGIEVDGKKKLISFQPRGEEVKLPVLSYE